MATNPQRPGSEITPEDEQIIQERMKTYDLDRKDTVDAKEQLEHSIRERTQKRAPQPR